MGINIFTSGKNLQRVTDAGNETTNDIVVYKDGTDQESGVTTDSIYIKKQGNHPVYLTAEDAAADQTLKLPATTGTLLATINGKVADASGNIIAGVSLLPLKNYAGDTNLSFPLGVFSTTGTYLGIATTAAEYITLWNAAADNQAVGQILSTLSGTNFVFAPIYINSVVTLYAQEYYSIQAPANVVLHLDDGDTVVYGSTVKKAVDSALVDSDTKREWNPDVFSAGVQYHVPQFFCREVTCTGYTNNAVMRIFHSRTSKVFGSRTAFGQYLISGLLPTGLKYFYVCGQSTTNYNSVTNWASLSALEWFITDHKGGGVWQIVESALPADLNITSLKGIQIGQYGTATTLTNAKAILSRITGTIKQVAFTQNAAIKFMDSTFIDAIPKFSEMLYLSNYSTSGVTSTEVDYALNTLATKLNGIVPSGEAAIVLKNSNVRTSASDAAYTALTGAGWTITLI